MTRLQRFMKLIHELRLQVFGCRSSYGSRCSMRVVKCHGWVVVQSFEAIVVKRKTHVKHLHKYISVNTSVHGLALPRLHTTGYDAKRRVYLRTGAGWSPRSTTSWEIAAVVSLSSHRSGPSFSGCIGTGVRVSPLELVSKHILAWCETYR